MPIPMPMPTDTGLYTEPGFGFSDTSEVRIGGEIDLMYTEDMGLPFDSGVVDMEMEVQSLSEVAQ